MLRTAIIGLGWWGSHLAQTCKDSARLRIVRGFDPRGDGPPGLPLAASFETILADPSVDAVILATPHRLHEAQTLAALAAGKAVFCEKPLAMSAAAARRMLEAARVAKLPLGVGHERRFEPAMEETLAILKSGRHGQLLHIEANVSHDNLARLAPGNWRHDEADAPAGAMTGLGVHLTDLFISFAGRPVSLRARTAKNSEMPAAADFVSADMRFASGVTAAFSCLSATPYYGRLTAFSRSGWIEVRESANVDRGQPSELVVCDSDGLRQSRSFAAAPTARANLESWAAAVRGEAPYRFSPEQIFDNVKVFEAVVASARLNAAEIVLEDL